VEKALDAEMTEHLGHDKHEVVANAAGNTRNTRSRKTLKGATASVPARQHHGRVAVPAAGVREGRRFRSGLPAELSVRGGSPALGRERLGSLWPMH